MDLGQPQLLLFYFTASWGKMLWDDCNLTGIPVSAYKSRKCFSGEIETLFSSSEIIYRAEQRFIPLSTSALGHKHPRGVCWGLASLQDTGSWHMQGHVLLKKFI